ncbi:MAG: bifunctional folylpolyglutamate synthase/dihydrofolate synthase [Acetatifactor sp.]|nr:bifunctional folylpolyglutamate synthase/dihydrofolate synthase [Acetatifactor sp.]
MTERQVMEYIEQVSSFGIVPGLDSIRELCRRLGNPQKRLHFIHIAGTNGKGSVSAYIASVLRCAGYRVGRYISPVIFEYRERIQVNGRMITKNAMCYGIERIKAVCDEMVSEGLPHPTAFEVETALGFLYFLEKNCDIVVLETGVGGLLDATNIVENTITAVFTSISMDHMKLLGNTLEEIATQKAGVIKPGCAVVSTPQNVKAMEVLSRRASELSCSFAVSDPGKLDNVRFGLERQRFDYGKRKKLEISLAGRYQVENAALAVEVLDVLGERGFPVKEEQLRRGLRETEWTGRFTIINKRPIFIVDGAHNEDAAKRLAESVSFYFTNRKIIYIMGVLRDKEYDKIIALTHEYADHIITVTSPGNPRALPAYELALEVAKVHPKVTAVDSLEEAVEMSQLLAGSEGVIIAFGSLSYLGRLMEIAGATSGKAAKRHGR